MAIWVCRSPTQNFSIEFPVIVRLRLAAEEDVESHFLGEGEQLGDLRHERGYSVVLGPSGLVVSPDEPAVAFHSRDGLELHENLVGRHHAHLGNNIKVFPRQTIGLPVDLVGLPEDVLGNTVVHLVV